MGFLVPFQSTGTPIANSPQHFTPTISPYLSKAFAELEGLEMPSSLFLKPNAWLALL